MVLHVDAGALAEARDVPAGTSRDAESEAAHSQTVLDEAGGITLDAAGEVEFLRPDGRPFPAAPPPPLWTGAPLAPVTERLDQEGVTIDSQTATPAWKGERMDTNWVVDSLWRPRLDTTADSDPH